ncbi:sigma-70 family RNA polymerase sigma factor [Actinoplanes awajinensis]|uniref:RNA polymerase subunit sigma-70 n=1 Tax=Actinoplanes awajinensis subsp. mycoplanecinus TaxID=135947 RepID=A0A124G859_9ACTN|nr:sigma-70 family RNA polymerase sigma factor [Actinoplanes awajinensis]KUL24877.1 RNA polymerase subunit sigma-70 [Actinoplanes awajinensis subsp. mycoplanecinus]
MSESEFLARRFEDARPHLRTVAQRILGSAHEADDAVQEAWVRVIRADTGDVGNLTGWLTTVVSRICLDMLRSRSARREDPAELPVTVPAAAAGPEDEVLLTDAIGPALLLVLDTLSPGERLAFVLHDLFGVPFSQIAEVVGCTPEAARQLASRARRRVRGAEGPAEHNLNRRRAVVDAFLAASRGGDFGALLELLDPEVVLRADAAAVAMGSDERVTGADLVARTFTGRAQAARLALIDGQPGAAWLHRGEPRVLFVFTIGATGLVAGIELLAEPGGRTVAMV